MELLPESPGTYAGPQPGSPEHIRTITAELRRLYPDAKGSLDFTNPLELLVFIGTRPKIYVQRANFL
jgi:hypothetical protein